MDDVINDINDYLKILKNELTELVKESSLSQEKLQVGENKKIVYILGNTSCDLDSFISSLSLSIFRNLFNETENFNTNKLRNCKTLFIPIFNCKKSDFCDRLDINFLLKKYNIGLENLIFIDDENLQKDLMIIKYSAEETKEYINKGKIKKDYSKSSKILETLNDSDTLLDLFKKHNQVFTEYYRGNREGILIDHNKLDEKQIFLKDFVTEIIDHHNDSDCNLVYKNLKKKSLIYPLGSCSTLILLENLKYLEQYLVVEEAKNNFAIQNFFKKSFKDFLIFISAVIIDTRNFYEIDYNKRWSNLDVLAFNRIIDLNEKFYLDNKTEMQLDKIKQAASNLYEDLVNSKYDLEANLNLGVKKLMNKDKKEFKYDKNKTVIWSSLQVSLDKIIEKFGLENLTKEVNEALEDKDVYVFNYRDKLEETTYTFVAIFINESKENDNSKLKIFCENFGGYIKHEVGNDVFDLKIAHNSYCRIRLNQSVTRKNFEPFLNTYFKQYTLN